MVEKIYRIKGVSSVLGISTSHIHNKRNPRSPYHDPEFPEPISLGTRARGWTESSLQQYIELLAQGAETARKAVPKAGRLEHDRDQEHRSGAARDPLSTG